MLAKAGICCGVPMREALRAAVLADSGLAAPGIAPSRLFAMRSSVASSTPGAPTAVTPGRTPAALAASLVVMVVAYFDVLEDSERVLGQHCGREIQGHKIRRGRIVIDAHEAYRQSRHLLAGK